MADDLEDVVEPEELPDEELGELPDEELDEDLVGDLDVDDLAVEEVGIELPVGEDPLGSAAPAEVSVVAVPTLEEGEEDEEEEDDVDVEASLDEILKERLVVEEEEDDVPETEDRSETSERVLPKQADEFVCSSCFLVKHSSQLADPAKGLCRDCV
jgi:hypothetical protein